eukprot:2472139-Pyramimonas_sp.AAC.1
MASVRNRRDGRGKLPVRAYFRGWNQSQGNRAHSRGWNQEESRVTLPELGGWSASLPTLSSLLPWGEPRGWGTLRLFSSD